MSQIAYLGAIGRWNGTGPKYTRSAAPICVREPRNALNLDRGGRGLGCGEPRATLRQAPPTALRALGGIVWSRIAAKGSNMALMVCRLRQPV